MLRLAAAFALLFALGGCIQPEEALPSGDDPAEDPPAADAPVTPPADPPPADPPQDPPPADPPQDPPQDPAPGDPPPADPPADPPPADPPADPPPDDKTLFGMTLHVEFTAMENRCVVCHASLQAPTFANANLDDAYGATQLAEIVDLGDPGASRVVQRAALDRHNCGNDGECDAIASNFSAAISQWQILASAGNPPSEPPPEPPTEPPSEPPPADDPPADDPPAEDPPADDPPPEEPPVDDPPPADPPEDEMPPPVDDDPPMEPLPEDVALFAATLHPLLIDPANFCVGCHANLVQPLYAVTDVTSSYSVLISQQKVDVQNPTNSRIYLRAATDRHNCGGVAECDRIAAAFLAAIESWKAQAAPPEPPPPAAAVSASTSFANAVDAAVPRAEANLIARFEFLEGTGDTTTDTSGVGAPIALGLQGTEWVDGGGLRIVSGKAQASTAASQRLTDAISASGSMTVEAWVIPDNAAQDGPARIVTLSNGFGERNFTLGQNAIYYQLRNRAASTNNNGTPALEALTPEVALELTHVAATFDPANGRSIYINGALAITEAEPDTLEWIAGQTLVLGNETTDERLWQGVLKLVAIHDAALTPEQVQQNFEAGTGSLASLSFDLAGAIGQPGRIDMIATQIDNASYLFAEPTYVGDVNALRIKNLRISVNESIPVAAQAFRRIDTTADSGTLLSELGAVIPATLGVEQDQFRLEFELLGNATGSPDAIAPAVPPPAPIDVEEPDVGLRSFAQLNDTMSSLTDVPTTDNAVANAYAELRGQLPATNDPLAFGPSGQIAIQRLAVTYCGALVNNGGRCNALFGACRVDGAVDKPLIADKLYERFIGNGLANQPATADVSQAVVGLIDQLGCADGCNGAAGRDVLQAACAAVLASGAVTLF